MSRSEARYRGPAGRRYHENKRSLPPAAYSWVARSRAAKLTPHVGLQDVVLEYGVGTGWNLAALPCRRRVGYDIADSVEASVAQHGIEFTQDLKQFPTGTADVVLCHHTLEHLLQPSEVLVTLNRLLRPSGRLLLFVPWEQERRLRRFVRTEPNHHLYTWSVQSLGNLVEDCGYQVLRARALRYGYDRFAAVWACRLHLGEQGFRLLRRLLQLGRPLREVCLVAQPKSPATSEESSP